VSDPTAAHLTGVDVYVSPLAADLRLPLLEAGERLAHLGSFEWLPGTDRLIWSDNLFRIYGLAPGEVAPTRELMRRQTHPDDRARVTRAVEKIRRNPNPPPIEYRIVQPSSAVRYLRSTIVRIDSEDHTATRVVGTVQDITDQRLANREIAAHVAVSRVLAEWVDVEHSTPTLLHDLATAMEFACAALWIPDGDTLVCRFFSACTTADGIAAFETETRALRLKRGSGLPGQVWESRHPINIADLANEPDFQRRPAAARAGLRGAAVFPALAAGEVLAVLEFYYREEFRPTLRLIQSMNAIGDQLGEFFSRRRGDLHRQPLSTRELQILKLASEGKSTPEIAALLTLRATTIKTHLDHAYRKLNASDRASAVATAIRWGLID
jgi:DNA-binding NarL/FixJ family response regulator